MASAAWSCKRRAERITEKKPASGLGRRPGKTASDRLGPRRHQATDDAGYEHADRGLAREQTARAVPTPGLPDVPGQHPIHGQGDELHPGKTLAAHDIHGSHFRGAGLFPAPEDSPAEMPNFRQLEVEWNHKVSPMPPA